MPDKGTVCGLFEALSKTESVPVRDPNWVGVKTITIWQLAPPTNVLPQGFGLVACAKSPLTVMLLMFSVPVPLLVRVAVFPLLDCPITTVPKVRALGVRLMLEPLISWFTVSVMFVVCVKLPDTPVMVTVTVPVAAVALAVSVNVLLVVVGFGLNPAVTPLGSPEALKVTLPLKPLIGFTVILLVPLVP